MDKIKVFKVGEVDWIAARTEDEAVKCLADLCYGGDLDCDDMEMIREDGVDEISDEAMLTLKHAGEDGCQEGYPISFREELDKMIAAGETFPCHFASTEY